jgi:hypothetical protein
MAEAPSPSARRRSGQAHVAPWCGAPPIAWRWCRSATSRHGRDGRSPLRSPSRSCSVLLNLAERVVGAETVGARSDARPAPTGTTARRTASSARVGESIDHLGPFCRSLAPAGPMPSSHGDLVSPCDASLSAPRTCLAVRGSGPAGLHAVGELGAASDSVRLHAEPILFAGGAHTSHRTADHDRSERRAEAERDTAHR